MSKPFLDLERAISVVAVGYKAAEETQGLWRHRKPLSRRFSPSPAGSQTLANSPRVTSKLTSSNKKLFSFLHSPDNPKSTGWQLQYRSGIVLGSGNVIFACENCWWYFYKYRGSVAAATLTLFILCSSGRVRRMSEQPAVGSVLLCSLGGVIGRSLRKVKFQGKMHKL